MSFLITGRGGTIFTLSRNEFEVVSVLWDQGRPLTRAEIIRLSPDKSWKESTFHILLNSLIQKEAVQVVGFAQTGKRYGRTYSAIGSREDYTAMQLMKNASDSKKHTDIPGVFAALIEMEDIDSEILAKLEEIVERKKNELSK